ncbi:MAG TPA: amidohydrolase family protein [Candidatus Methylomirabilis sp.]|nr:amidohydrolase family protein [Candidatus Methylomirabilis sp.]
MDGTLIFENAFLIDGTGADPQEGATVVVAGGVIQEVAGRGAKQPSGRRMDLRGKTLMPGLIDAHVHIGNIEIRNHLTAQLPAAVYVLRACKNLETDLDLGFTTVRDAAGLDPGFRAAVDQGLVRGPRLLLSVTPLAQSGGSTPVQGFGPDRPMPRNALGIYPEICDGPEHVRGAARRTLGRGADQIKVFADGEVLAAQAADRARPGQWKFSVEELRAAVEVAEAAGTYVMAHVYAPRAIQNCLRAGVRSIEHGNLMDEETARLMAEAGAFYVPTLTTYDLLVKNGRSIGLDDYSLEKLALVGQSGRRAVELAHRAGVKIASGSDIVGPGMEQKGRELSIKAEILGPMGAIVSATKTNANLLKLGDKLGTVEPGKLADLIVLDGNPLRDLGLFEKGLTKVSLVLKEGRVMKDLLS